MSSVATLLAAIVLGQAQPAETPSLPPGTIAVEQDVPAPKPDPARQAFADAVGEALTDAGFLALPDADHARYVATIKITRIGRGSVLSSASKDGARVNNGLAAAGAGATLGVSLPTGKSRVGELVSTELEVRIHRRGESQTVWDGRATTAQVDGTRSGDPPAVAARLARALFRNFPGGSGLTVSVP